MSFLDKLMSVCIWSIWSGFAKICLARSIFNRALSKEPSRAGPAGRYFVARRKKVIWPFFLTSKQVQENANIQGSSRRNPRW